MSFSIITTDFFERELKHLAKKYPSIKNDMAALVEQLLQQPSTGTPISNDCYKIRLAISLQRAKANPVAQGLLHICVLPNNTCTCFPSLINQKLKTYQIRNCKKD